MEDIPEAERTATCEYREPQGELVISVLTVMGRTHVVPILVDFLSVCPAVRLHVQFTDRKVNLLEEHVDIALRVGHLPDSSLVAARIGLIREVVCASPAYLKRRGTPKEPADLAEHECVTYEGVYVTTNKWEFITEGKAMTIEVPSRLVVNSADAALEAAIGGAGIARVFSYHVDAHVKSRKLVKLVENFERASLPVSLIYPSQRLVPQKLRVFLDFAMPRLRERLGI